MMESKVKKAKATPLAFRFIQSVFPLLQTFLPTLANEWGYRLFMTPIRAPFSPKQEDFLNSSKRHQIPVRGVDVSVYEWGEGEDCVFLVHGWMGRASQWHLLVDELVALGYKVVAFDAKAHGKTSGKRSNILEFASALMAIQEKFGTPKATVGHSLGAASIFLAIKLGFKTGSVVSLAQPVIANDILLAFRLRLKSRKALDFGVKSRILRDFDAVFEEFTTQDTVKYATDVPYLILHDPEDEEAYFSNALWLKDQLKRVELVEIEGPGHYRIVKDSRVIAAVVAFVHERNN